MIANFFFGLGSMIVFALSTTMLTEFMPKRSSSGVACNNFVRNTVACIGGIVAAPVIDGIGNGWTFTGLAVIAWSGSAVIYLMGKHGSRWGKEMNVVIETSKWFK
jgi:MFS family permease